MPAPHHPQALPTMARATRSAVDHEKVEDEGAALPPQKSTKSAGKKRKRVAGEDEEPLAKQQRSESADADAAKAPTPVALPYAGDAHMPQEDAQKMLDVLEACVGCPCSFCAPTNSP